jgi:predicted aspartyl protease
MIRFNGERGLIVIRAELFGPTGSIVLRLALDTGATGTMVNVGLLTAIGYDPSLAPDRVEVTTGNSVVYAPRLAISRIKVMGQERTNFSVLAHTLPPSAGIDGLLRLDFLREQELNIDFRNGRLSLS